MTAFNDAALQLHVAADIACPDLIAISYRLFHCNYSSEQIRECLADLRAAVTRLDQKLAEVELAMTVVP